MSDLIDKHIELNRHDWKESTLLKSIYHAGKLKALFEGEYLEDLNRTRIDEFRIQVVQKPDGGKYSAEYTRAVANLLKAVLERAVDDDLISKNPYSKRVKVPDGIETDPKQKRLTADQVMRLRHAVKGNIHYSTIVDILLGTGLRINELLALSWDDVDIENKRICVKCAMTKTLVGKGGSRYELGDTKTACSRRSVPLFPEVAEALKRWQNYVEGNLRLRERIEANSTSGFVMVNTRGKTYNYQALQDKFGEWLDKPKSEWARMENAHPHIISKHDFDLVQKIMRLDTRTAPHENKVYLFSGILICGCCGKRMTRKTISKDSGKYYYYFCPTGKKGGCTTPLVKESDLTESVWLMLKAYIENIVSLERLLSNIDAEQLTSELAKNCKAKIATSEAKLEQIEQFKMSLYENLVEEIISKDEHRLYKKKYDEESKQIETALDGLRRELDDITGNRAEYERQISESMNEITTLETGLNAFEAQAVKQAEWTESMKHLQSGGELTALLINRLVERIEISHDKTITVILKTTEVTI